MGCQRLNLGQHVPGKSCNPLLSPQPTVLPSLDPVWRVEPGTPAREACARGGCLARIHLSTDTHTFALAALQRHCCASARPAPAPFISVAQLVPVRRCPFPSPAPRAAAF